MANRSIWLSSLKVAKTWWDVGRHADTGSDGGSDGG